MTFEKKQQYTHLGILPKVEKLQK